MGITARGLQAYRQALLLTALVCGTGADAHAAEVMKIAGTGAALGTMELLGAEFAKSRPDLQVQVLPYIGSTGAIKAVHTGAISIGLSGRPADADEQKLDVRLVRYAITPFAIVTHPDVKASGITRGQLAAIYSGKQTRWQDGTLIRLILRPAKETDSQILKTISAEVSSSLDSALRRKGMTLAGTDQEAADVIAATTGALGTTTLALLVSEKRTLNVLALDGVMPTTKALSEGSYPYYKPLYLVVPKSPSPTVKAFVEFVFSSAGRSVLLANAQVPVAD